MMCVNSIEFPRDWSFPMDNEHNYHVQKLFILQIINNWIQTHTYAYAYMPAFCDQWERSSNWFLSGISRSEREVLFCHPLIGKACLCASGILEQAIFVVVDYFIKLSNLSMYMPVLVLFSHHLYDYRSYESVKYTTLIEMWKWIINFIVIIFVIYRWIEASVIAADIYCIYS